MKWKIINWINKINSKKPYFNRGKPKEGSNYQRDEMNDIFGLVTRVKNQVLYARVTSIPKVKSYVITENEIRVTYDFVIKIT